MWPFPGWDGEFEPEVSILFSGIHVLYFSMELFKGAELIYFCERMAHKKKGLQGLGFKALIIKSIAGEWIESRSRWS